MQTIEWTEEFQMPCLSNCLMWAGVDLTFTRGGLVDKQPAILILYKGRHKRESKNKKQETKRFSTFAVSRLRHSEKKKKTLLDSRIKFLAKHVWNSQSTIYLKSHGCVHGLQNEMSLINVSMMFC